VGSSVIIPVHVRLLSTTRLGPVPRTMFGKQTEGRACLARKGSQPPSVGPGSYNLPASEIEETKSVATMKGPDRFREAETAEHPGPGAYHSQAPEVSPLSSPRGSTEGGDVNGGPSVGSVSVGNGVEPSSRRPRRVSLHASKENRAPSADRSMTRSRTTSTLSTLPATPRDQPCRQLTEECSKANTGNEKNWRHTKELQGEVRRLRQEAEGYRKQVSGLESKVAEQQRQGGFRTPRSSTGSKEEGDKVVREAERRYKAMEAKLRDALEHMEVQSEENRRLQLKVASLGSSPVRVASTACGAGVGEGAGELLEQRCKTEVDESRAALHIASLERELEKSHDANMELKERVTRSEVAIETRCRELVSEKAKNSELEEEKVRLGHKERDGTDDLKRVAEAEEGLLAAREEAASACERADEQERRIARIEHSRATSVARIAELEEQLARHSTNIVTDAELQEQNARLRLEVQALERENQQLKEKLNEADLMEIQVRGEKLDEVNKIRAHCAQQIDDVRRETLEENRALLRRVHDLEEGIVDSPKLKVLEAELQDYRERLQKESEQLVQEQERTSSAEVFSAELRADLERAKKELNQESYDKMSALSTVTESEDRACELEEQLRELQLELQQAKDRLKGLGEAAKDARWLHLVSSASAQASTERRMKVLSTRGREVVLRGRRFEKVFDDGERKEEELQRLDKEVEDVARQNSELNTANHFYKAQFEDQLAELKRLKEREASYEADMEKERDENARLCGHTNPQQKIKHVQDIKQERNRLQEELRKAKQKIADYEVWRQTKLSRANFYEAGCEDVRELPRTPAKTPERIARTPGRVRPITPGRQRLHGEEAITPSRQLFGSEVAAAAGARHNGNGHGPLLLSAASTTSTSCGPPTGGVIGPTLLPGHAAPLVAASSASTVRQARAQARTTERAIISEQRMRQQVEDVLSVVSRQEASAAGSSVAVASSANDPLSSSLLAAAATQAGGSGGVAPSFSPLLLQSGIAEALRNILEGTSSSLLLRPPPSSVEQEEKKEKEAPLADDEPKVEPPAEGESASPLQLSGCEPEDEASMMVHTG